MVWRKRGRRDARFVALVLIQPHPTAEMSAPFSRPNWAHVDLDALRHNARVLAQLSAPARLICVVKADAYGHGALPVARALQELPAMEMLAVASVDEGAQLRAGGIEKPILLLSALLPQEARDAAFHDLTPTIWTIELAAAWSDAARAAGRELSAHFKVDTGMARLGVPWCDAVARWRALQRFGGINWCGVYTHFASADEADADFSALQLQRFEQFLDAARIEAPTLRHAANSAAQLRFARARLDAVRPGLALYGAHPYPHPQLRSQFHSPADEPLDLRPVMTRLARVTEVREVSAGQSVSYGATWRAGRDSRLAVVACGYADGYLRALSNCGEVLVGGARFPVVGRVTMDQILVDVTDAAPPIVIGAPVTLWGRNLPVEEVAARANTISYELLCAVSARVPRVYSD